MTQIHRSWVDALKCIRNPVRHLERGALSRQRKCMERTIYSVIAYLLLCITLVCVHGWANAAEVPIVRSGRPMATIQIGATASAQEKFAAEEIQTFIRRFTGAELDIFTNRQTTTTPTVIVLGTPDSNPVIRLLLAERLLHLDANISDEGYVLKTVELDNELVIAIAGNASRGVLYGAYDVIEACITRLTGLSPADLDFVVQPSPNLDLPLLDKTSQPFYPVRAGLEVENVNWFARHRLNMSGGEGVWTGTGIDDGLGTAVKYINSPDFETLQDEPFSQRQQRIQKLRNRFQALHRRGIDSYLFMYVTGEPTKAVIERRPDVLGPRVPYSGSRNRVDYRPFCWSKPEFQSFARVLIKEIVKTYPTLAGFHLRAWGVETRACHCPECGDTSEKGQDLLWQVIFTIIDAAQQVRPDFKFYISGYDRFWLKDPNSDYARQLPAGTIFSQKWGADGEPTADARISIDRINTLGDLGHRLIVLSHDVEEVVPFWMVEGDLFVHGVRELSNNPAVTGLGGFTVQGTQNNLGHLDRLVSARINWDVETNHLQLMENYLVNQYGADAAKLILNAVRINTWVLESYFSDYAGSLSIAGNYGRGSAGLATRFWDIIGPEAVADTLSMPNLKAARTATGRFSSLLPQQQRAANEIESALRIARPVSEEAARHLEDAVGLMRLWVQFFESRLRLTEAVQAGYEEGKENLIRTKLHSAIEYSKSLTSAVKSFHTFVTIFGYNRQINEAILLKQINEEITWLSNFDPQILIRDAVYDSPQKPALKIDTLRNYPNPFDEETTLMYELTKDADEASISIYSKAGRRVRVLKGVSAREGYNEAMWDGRDEHGTMLANGVYLYKVYAVADSENTQALGRLAILR